MLYTYKSKIHKIYSLIIFHSIFFLFFNSFSCWQLLAQSLEQQQNIIKDSTEVHKKIDKNNKKTINQNIKILPKNILREYDSITFSFPENMVSSAKVKNRAYEDNGEKYFKFSEEYDGQYIWIDRKTLQFKPAESWPSAKKITLLYQQGKKQKEHFLYTFLEKPRLIYPSDQQQNLSNLEMFQISFQNKIDAKTLKKVISIFVVDLEEDENQTKKIDADEFFIKEGSRKNDRDQYRFTIQLKKKIDFNKKVTIDFKISTEKKLSNNTFQYSFSTLKKLQIVSFGTRYKQLPVSKNGSKYNKQQSIQITDGQKVAIYFSHSLKDINYEKFRNLVSIVPKVNDLNYRLNGKTLFIEAQFKPKQKYRIKINSSKFTGIYDRFDRELKVKNSHFFIEFKPKKTFLNWKASSAILEEYGPKYLPMQTRGVKKVDLRIYQVDSKSRKFWPIGQNVIVIDEKKRPHSPGEELKINFDSMGRYINQREFSDFIKTLSTPNFSQIISLPLSEKQNGRVNFGLNISPYLEKINPSKSSSYLIGYREIGKNNRYYMKFQTTDLCLTAIPEARGMTLVVTSYKTSLPISKARIILEGYDNQNYNNRKNPQKWRTLYDYKTDSQGKIFIPKPLHYSNVEAKYIFKRIIIQKGSDQVIYSPTEDVQYYANNHFTRSIRNWTRTLTRTKPKPKEFDLKGFIFTERPIYKLKEDVFVKFYLRNFKDDGSLNFPFSKSVQIRIDGPGGRRWSKELNLNQYYNGDYIFKEKNLPTGRYTVSLYAKLKDSYGGYSFVTSTTFRKEEYRIPTFEVTLTSPSKVTMDKPFDVKLVADYYAGGNLSEAKVKWTVNRFPHYFKLPNQKKYKDYFFYSDSKYTQFNRFKNSGVNTKSDKTDNYGGAILKIDPTKEADSRTSRYVVEATVTDKDNQDISSTIDVIATPAFFLGMSIQRYYEKISALKPKLIALNNKGKKIKGLVMNLKVTKREWHSYLIASPIADSKPTYRTEKVDNIIYQKKVISDGQKEIEQIIDIQDPGIYILELESYDDIGRMQKIKVDCFVNGDGAVSWEEPKKEFTFRISSDKKKYYGGEKANLVIHSPFDNAKVLAIIEEPKTTYYRWIDVFDKKGVLGFYVKNNFSPKIPITFVLMKPRGEWSEKKAPFKNSSIDYEKPVTMVSTFYVSVVDKNKKVKLKISHPQKVTPGKKVTFNISLKSIYNKGMSGEVCLWLVDRSVLSLGRKISLNDIFSVMNRKVYSQVSVYDFRNVVYGRIPWYENPGGGGRYSRKKNKVRSNEEMDLMFDAKEKKSLLEEITVRKSFKTIAYYNPSIRLDEKGMATVTFTMPDNLTDFAIRAIASSGKNSFATAESKILVRLPILVQPALPRFVRYGDQFYGGGIARVVDGKDGKGIIKIKGDGVKIGEINKQGSKQKNNQEKTEEIVWKKNKTKPIFEKITVNEYSSAKPLSNITIALLGARYYDEAKDGFQIEVPIKRAKSKIYQSDFFVVNSLTNINIASTQIPFVKESLKQKVTFTYEPALLKMIAGLDYLIQFPHGCLEQKVSKSMAAILMKTIYNQMGIEDKGFNINASIKETMKTIEKNLTSNGLFSYWPGSQGYVNLTAYVFNYLMLAKKAGYVVEQRIMERAATALKKALRSDYNYFINSSSIYERVAAFESLANSGHLDSSYVDEMYNRSKFSSLETRSKLFFSLKKNNYYNKEILKDLENDIWKAINFKLRNGKELYAGMNYGYSSWGNLMNTYETKAMATVLRALSKGDKKKQDKVKKIFDVMVGMGKLDGWGNTIVNATAIESLSEYLSSQNKKKKYPQQNLNLSFDNQQQGIQLENSQLLIVQTNKELTKISIADEFNQNSLYPSLAIGVEKSFLPSGMVESIPNQQNGFVISSDLTKVATEKNQLDEKIIIKTVNQTNRYKTEDIVEMHVEVVNPKDRNFVAVVIPIAATFEVMNPNLKTSSSLAKPSKQNTLKSTYDQYLDDEVRIYYNQLPKGNYHFYFRMKATSRGDFSQPASYVEMMYRQKTRATTHGLRVIVGE